MSNAVSVSQLVSDTGDMVVSSIRNVKGTFNGGGSTSVQKNSDTITTLSRTVQSSTEAVSSATSVVSDLIGLGTNLSEAFDGSLISQQFSKVGESFSNTAQSYLQSKIKRLKDLWDTKVDVTVQGLIGEVAPYAMGMEDLGKNLSKKLASVTSYLLGTGDSDSWRGVVSDLGDDVLNTLASDSSLVSSVSNLSVVKATADTFNVIIGVVNTVNKIMETLELARPLVSSGCSFALSFWSGGTSALEGVNTVSSEAQRWIAKAEELGLYALKKIIFPLKIKVPALVVGAIDSISVRDVMLDTTNPNYNIYAKRLFDDEFFSDLEYTSQWHNAIADATDAVRKSVKDIKGLVDQVSTKELYKNTLTSSYLNQASIIARKEAQTYNSLYTDNSLVINGLTASKSSSKTETPTLDDLIDDIQDMNPITSAESLIRVSKTILDSLDK